MQEQPTAREERRKTVSMGAKVYAMTLIAAVFGVLLFLSLNLVATLGQRQTGYQVYYRYNAEGNPSYFRYDEYGINEDETDYELKGTYVYDAATETYQYSAEDTEKVKNGTSEEPEDDTTYTIKLYQKNTVLVTVMEVISQIIMLVIFIACVYDKLWVQGDSDRNAVSFGRRREDKWRGLKEGLIASIPSGILVVGLFISKLGGVIPNYASWYRLGTAVFAPLMNTVSAGATQTADLPWVVLPVSVLLWAVLPLVAMASYALGYRQFSIKEHVLFTKKKK